MSRFDELVKELQEEHDKERQEVCRLRSELAKHASFLTRQATMKRNSELKKGEQIAQADGEQSPDGDKTRGTDCTRSTKKPGFALPDSAGNSGRKVVDMHAVRSELRRQIGTKVFGQANEEMGKIKMQDRIMYRLENLSSMYENVFLYLLVVITLVAAVLLGIFWKIAAEEEEDDFSAFYYYFDMFQVISTAGIDDSIRTLGKATVYTVSVATGLIVFASLIGIIDEKFRELVESMNGGRSIVPEKNHTLLLGWNESTERVVCQLAFLRRQYIMANSTCAKKYFWWKRTPAATPVAQAKIVILCDTKTKAEMHEAIERAFVERGVSPKRTRVGWDVICRVGDPTNPQDLVMVGAQHAVGIAVMMTQHDLDEEAAGGSSNAVTFRTVLALRKVLFTPDFHPPWKDLRIVVPLSTTSKAIHSAAFSAPSEDLAPRQVVLCQDLSIFLNTLMFTCATQPGLADVFMELMSFDGVALRLRKVKDFPNQGQHLVGKTIASMSHRWGNAILVGIIPSRLMEADVLDPENGMAPMGRRVIKHDDRLVFISEKSLPLDHEGPLPRSSIGKKPAFSLTSGKPTRILVCGFRKEWKDPGRFAYQIVETCHKLANSSSVHFLNLMDSTDFRDLMSLVCLKSCEYEEEANIISPVDSGNDDTPSDMWDLGQRIMLRFSEGDSSNYDTLEGVLVDNDGFDVAIVVPPVNSTLSAQAQDTRLMTIMCTLRAICEDHALPPVHVIGENKLESSAQIAIRPKCDETIDETDFVNVQAIIARALCQGLAFPSMQPAVVQLFSSEESSPCIHLSPAPLFVPCGTQIYFCDLIGLVKKECEDAICIGYRITVDHRVQTILCPKLDDSCVFKVDDVIIVIARHEPGTQTHKRQSAAPDVSAHFATSKEDDVTIPKKGSLANPQWRKTDEGKKIAVFGRASANTASSTDSAAVSGFSSAPETSGTDAVTIPKANVYALPPAREDEPVISRQLPDVENACSADTPAANLQVNALAHTSPVSSARQSISGSYGVSSSTALLIDRSEGPGVGMPYHNDDVIVDANKRTSITSDKRPSIVNNEGSLEPHIVGSSLEAEDKDALKAKKAAKTKKKGTKAGKAQDEAALLDHEQDQD